MPSLSRKDARKDTRPGGGRDASPRSARATNAWAPAAACVILRVSALVEVVPELRELDLNPVKVLAPGKGAVVVDGRMRIGPPRIVS